MSGIAYYQFIEKLEQEFEQRKEQIVENLELLTREILRPENLSVSYTGERESLDQVKKQVKVLRQTLHTEEVERSQEKIPVKRRTKAL